MSKARAKSKNSSRKPAPAAPSGRNKWLLVAGLVVVVAVIGIVWVNANRPSGAASSAAGATPAVPAAEAKYLGRLLPASYKEPTVPPVTYSGVTNMTDITAVTKGSQVTVSLADVTSGKIVYFEYNKTGADPIPMIAHIKPSGRLFVGVSYCIPCKGKKQFVDADGTLTCASCGTKRNLETGVGISGACRLYPLDEIPSQVVGGKIVIDKSALDNWAPQPMDRPVGQ